MAAAARRGCAAQSPAGWRRSQADVVRELLAVHSELLPPQKRPDVTEIVRSSVGVEPDVYCWQPPSWAELAPQYAILRGGEEASLDGIADTERNRIDLAPGVCATLDNYLRRVRPTQLSSQNLELAQALVVLMHQAEQLHAPGASEAELECYAVQHVRPLVQVAWGPAFAEEIALHAWQIAYPRLPAPFRTPDCRDGGRLDRNPSSSVWP